VDSDTIAGTFARWLGTIALVTGVIVMAAAWPNDQAYLLFGKCAFIGGLVLRLEGTVRAGFAKLSSATHPATPPAAPSPASGHASDPDRS
jgi:hypothetical protein